jgi:hypothetical protein
MGKILAQQASAAATDTCVAVWKGAHERERTERDQRTCSLR